MKAEYQVKNRCEPIPYNAQRLQGFLGERMRINMKSLMQAPYYSYMRAYDRGVEALWPSGEYLGKFAQALLYSYQYTGEQFFIEQVQKIIDAWVKAQEADGYIATSPDGFAVGSRWNFWAVWDHKYTLLGLLDYYKAAKSEKHVLKAAARAADAVLGEFGPEKSKRDLMESGHAGMVGGSILEPMVYLYQHTGEEKYLDFCHYILKAFEQENGPKIVSELTERSGHVHKVGSGKGYEMLSCIIGIFRVYQLTGEAKLLAAVEQAWRDIAQNNLYVTGTATQAELFFGNRYLPADEAETLPGDHPWGLSKVSIGEGCVTAHWIYLSRLLFHLSGETKYIEEIEKSIHNHLFASQSALTGQQAYFTALIGKKRFQAFDVYGGAPPCCLSSVQRCIASIPETVWAKFADNGFAVLLYNPGEFEDTITTLDGEALRIGAKMREGAPASGTVKITLEAEHPGAFRLALRVPAWCGGFTVLLDGETLTGAPGEYLNIDREWPVKAEMTVSMEPADVVIEGSPSYPGHCAFKHGPYILALDQQLNPGVDIDRVCVGNPAGIKPRPIVPPEGWVGGQVYEIESEGSGRLVLAPFLDAGQNGSRYRVWIPGSL